MEDTAAAPLGSEPHYYYGEATESGPGTQCEWPADWEVSVSLLPVRYMLVFVLGLSGNGPVSFTVWWGPRAKRRSADTYVGDLALADPAVAVILPLWAAYTALRFHWPFGSARRKLSRYLVLLNMFASVSCLGCLSLQRDLAIVRLRAALAARVLPALLLRDTQPGPAHSRSAAPGTVPPRARACFAGAQRRACGL
ncbi:apelin receptor A-like [Mauremys mutica]|uniref:apelin receptor A-like n=1 Tax=Mauremys mutica TaxID=74926 RepID=UPI001D169FAA|nr:apelin receptor A-like [Mauremys mutica]